MLHLSHIVGGSREQRFAIWFVLGLGLLAAGVLGAGVFPGGPWEEGAAMLVTSGSIVLVFASAKMLRSGERPEQDERTRRIGAWGLSYSWFTTFLLLFVLFWMDYLNLLHLEVRTVLLVLVLAMALSARLYQWHFFRQGDVE